MPSPLEDFRATDRTKFDTDFWRRFLATLVAEVEGVKASKADYLQAVRDLEAVGLARINEALLPAYNEIAAAANLGALLTAHSSSTVSPAMGLTEFVIDAAERQRFAPTRYMWATAVDVAGRAAAGELVSYDRVTGLLRLDTNLTSGTGPASSWQVSIGVPPAHDQLVRWRKTASAPATVFTGADDGTVPLQFIDETESVYLNGVRLVRGLDYTTASGATVTLDVACAAGDVIEVSGWKGTREIATGPRGLKGDTGEAGPKGDTGNTGSTGPGYTATSASSVAIGTGSKVFTTQAGLAYVAGQRVRVANSATNYMEGDVVSYAGTTLTVNVTLVAGSGTFASWTIGIAGLPGGNVTSVNGQTGAVVIPVRDVLTANRTYYVRTDGNNANTGLVDSAGGAFLTIQKAFDVAATIDTNGFTLTIKIGAGTYSTNNTVKFPIGNGAFVVEGDTATPGNVIIANGAAATLAAFFADPASGSGMGRVTIRGFRFAGAGNCLRATRGCWIEFASIEFATTGAGGAHLYAQNGGVIRGSGAYTIAGTNAFRHIFAEDHGAVYVSGCAVTITGTPSLGAFAGVGGASVVRANAMTFTGSFTGLDYTITGNSVLVLAGVDFPGTATGTTATGGQVL